MCLRLFGRDPAVDLSSPKIVARSKPGVKKDRVEERLIWLLHTLCEDGHTLFLAGLPLIVDELERLMRAEPKANALVDSTVACIIGDLSIISQCRAQLDLYQPWADSFDHFFYIDWKDKLEAEFQEQTRPWAKIATAFKDLASVWDLAEPAEANLDAFRAKIDYLLRSRVGVLKGTAAGRLLTQSRILQRTPEWVEPAATRSRNRKTSDPSFETLNQQITDFGFQSTSVKEEPSTRALPPKSKIKTKGTPAATTEQAACTERAQSDLQPTFAVDVRALKVFRTGPYGNSARRR
ncbi:hypothetical protein NKR19_g3078 [Coniochaeta hoffmannii]|uniref:Uncharacterized protein n=1 Tax=Coniochaeta hoffmannii TaxID=91930 RepID=A0AA38W1R9_9PEZI|nr:hypothetical protein NKR19_g3078 [Coniochaeta hoffmannii]